jgi:hypothetical protein
LNVVDLRREKATQIDKFVNTEPPFEILVDERQDSMVKGEKIVNFYPSHGLASNLGVAPEGPGGSTAHNQISGRKTEKRDFPYNTNFENTTAKQLQRQ